MHIVLIGLAAGTLYLAVGIALVAVWSRADRRLGLNRAVAGFLVVVWPLALAAIVVLLVLFSLGEIVARVGRVGERGRRS
jgi:hypothetical protein